MATDSPKKVHLTLEEAEALKRRVKATELSDQDVKLIVGLISFNLWLHERLSRAQLSIRRLKNLFGIQTEKKTPKNKI